MYLLLCIYIVYFTHILSDKLTLFCKYVIIKLGNKLLALNFSAFAIKDNKYFASFLYSSIIFIFKVICDRESFLRSRLEARHFILQEPKHLKGITNVGPVYEFEEQIKYSAIFSFYNFLKIAIFYFCTMLFLIDTRIYMWLQIN